MTTVGLRELRQNASELVHRVELGEEITVTVAGRPSARLVAVAPRQWRRWSEVADLFDGPADSAWDVDRDRLDHSVSDAWTS